MNNLLKKYVKLINAKDSFLLDENNAIIVVENKNPEDSNQRYIYRHLRRRGVEIVEVNRWYISAYYFGSIHESTVIKSHSLFLVQNSHGRFDAAYNYIQGRFVIPQGIWTEIYTKSGKCDYLETYGCLVGRLEICSDSWENDHYTYSNSLTSREETLYFHVNDGPYYGLLDPTGAIRREKLFKGDKLSAITEIYDLSKFGSIEHFISIKKESCNDYKKTLIERIQKTVECRKIYGSTSPFEEVEVLRTLEMKPKMTSLS